MSGVTIGARAFAFDECRATFHRFRFGVSVDLGESA